MRYGSRKLRLQPSRDAQRADIRNFLLLVNCESQTRFVADALRASDDWRAALDGIGGRPAALFDNRIAKTNPNEKLGRFRTDRFQTA